MGSFEVEVEVTLQPLQLQVHEEVPKVRRITHSSTRKEVSSKSKDKITVDLDLEEAKFSSKQPTVDNVLNPKSHLRMLMPK